MGLLDKLIDKIFEQENYIKSPSPDMYDILTNNTTKVEILDGYIAISSSNKKALDKFRDRILASNSFEYEHRVKQHGEVTIHSYVFNMDKQESS